MLIEDIQVRQSLLRYRVVYKRTKTLKKYLIKKGVEECFSDDQFECFLYYLVLKE